MLVLTGEIGQELVIDMPDMLPVRIVVTGMEGKQVKLGIVAPLEVSVLRDELLKENPAEVGSV